MIAIHMRRAQSSNCDLRRGTGLEHESQSVELQLLGLFNALLDGLFRNAGVRSTRCHAQSQALIRSLICTDTHSAASSMCIQIHCQTLHIHHTYMHMRTSMQPTEGSKIADQRCSATQKRDSASMQLYCCQAMGEGVKHVNMSSNAIAHIVS